jgi:hypothetical protein
MSGRGGICGPSSAVGGATVIVSAVGDVGDTGDGCDIVDTFDDAD